MGTHWGEGTLCEMMMAIRCQHAFPHLSWRDGYGYVCGGGPRGGAHSVSCQCQERRNAEGCYNCPPLTNRPRPPLTPTLIPLPLPLPPLTNYSPAHAHSPPHTLTRTAVAGAR